MHIFHHHSRHSRTLIVPPPLKSFIAIIHPPPSRSRDHHNPEPVHPTPNSFVFPNQPSPIETEESEAGKRTPRRRRGRRRFGVSNCRVWSRDVGGSSRSVAGAVVANHRGYDSHLARGRRSEKGDDSRSWVLAGDASVGGWCRRRRASPSVGLAAAARAPGIVVVRGKWRKGLARDGEEKKKGRCVVTGIVTGVVADVPGAARQRWKWRADGRWTRTASRCSILRRRKIRVE
ncbi:hypothetical protein DEO72_LG2g808 [Vigna unguiculata]|uniref:Uncharacterized protein n=1 Tax=Vigna unguiculata TaxID=3917 RepID=A0A4D6KWT6_VIGUN|nr:hypothetical protein DEO72_LG2g808 [Vigna unguiculata]